MMISATEAATLLGITPRAVRARLARGDLRGRMDGGRWMVAREALPANEGANAARSARAAEIREAVESALPPRAAQSSRRVTLSLADLRSFQAGHAVARALRTSDAPGLAPVYDAMERGLLWLAMAWHEFEPSRRLNALQEARAAFCRAAGLLLLQAELPPLPPTAAWVDAIEQDVLPPLAGLLRRAEGALDDPRRASRP